MLCAGLFYNQAFSFVCVYIQKENLKLIIRRDTMKHFLIKTVCCLFLSLGFVGFVHATEHAHKHKTTGMSPDEQAIAAFMNNDMAKAWKSNKPGKVLELFTDNMPVIWFNGNSNKVVTSKAEREKELKTFFNKHKIMDFTATDLVVNKIDDNLGFVTSTQKLLISDMATEKESEITMKVVYEVVKENGKWNAYREMSFLADTSQVI